MKQYIDKSVVITEINRRIAENKKDIERASKKNLEDYFEGYEDALVLFKEKFLDTLEVKEVDLEQEIDDYIGTKEVWEIQEAPLISIENSAKYFFELGLKVQKGE